MTAHLLIWSPACTLVSVQSGLARFAGFDGLDARRQQVLSHVMACRTEAMGGERVRCTRCQYEQPRYHSCRDRHCPQCQGRARARWAEQQQAAVLPVPYYHLVFTLPHRLNGWVQCHPQTLYRLLFHSAWQTLAAFGERYLTGGMGMTAVLHTWGQTLTQHVHLHCLVPGGALDAGGQWHAARGDYLFPVKALSRGFRGRMVSALRTAWAQGEFTRLTRSGERDRVLDALMAEDWVVYTKACLAHTGTVIDYLARYTHQIGISNTRVIDVDADGVTFRYRDYRDNRRRQMHLSGHEFVRRWLLHVLPKGLTRVRHYGFLAGCCRRRRLADIRLALAVAVPAATDTGQADAPDVTDACPRCRNGRLVRVAELPAHPRLTRRR